MRILEVRALRGPNYWSCYRKRLILLRIDIEDFEHRPTHRMPGFLERLKAALPGVRTHRCSYKCEGGFLRRVEEGTWAGHLIEHFALELQTLAGMDTGFGRTRQTGGTGIYTVVFSYIDEEAGIYAARAAVETFLALADGRTQVETVRGMVEGHVRALKEIYERVKLGPSTASIVQEAVNRGIPAIRLNELSLVQLGYGARQQRIQASVTSHTSVIGSDLASDKQATKRLLQSMGIPVAEGYTVRTTEEIPAALERLSFPLVVKPADRNQGKGVTVGLRAPEEVMHAFAAARTFSERVIIERQVMGRDFRVLVVGNRCVAVAERVPAHVIGDGERTIAELIALVNADPQRGEGHSKVLTRIVADQDTLKLLALSGWHLDTVLPAGELCYLKTTANLSQGGTAIDRTDEIHPETRFLCERAAAVIGLDVAGIDVVTTDITRPLQETDGAVVEVNCSPGLRMHLAPSRGTPRNVAAAIVDTLFPPGTPSRIPIIAVTGTNGKTTTTRLIAHFMRISGKRTGFTTTDGTYLDDRMIMPGDNTGPVSAQRVLQDPGVEVAVLETARGGILRSGLGFDRCDIGVVMNVTADHLGLQDIHTLEDMARVKEVIPRSVADDGYAVLNADDPLVLRMRDVVDCNICLFSLLPDQPELLYHVKRGGLAAVYENGFITLLKGNRIMRIEHVQHIPLTYSGRAECMVQNALAATLAAFAHGISADLLRAGLRSFQLSPLQAPGRLNLIPFNGFSVLVDYAHNPSGFSALQGFLTKLNHQSRKVGVLSAPGDRRDQDIRRLGRMAGSMFTEIVLKEEEDRRGRAPGEMPHLLLEGIRSVNPAIAVQTIASEEEAVTYAVTHAAAGDLVVILVEKVPRVLEMLELLCAAREASHAAAGVSQDPAMACSTSAASRGSQLREA